MTNKRLMQGIREMVSGIHTRIDGLIGRMRSLEQEIEHDYICGR